VCSRQSLMSAVLHPSSRRRDLQDPLCITVRGMLLSLIRAKQSQVLHGRHCVGMLGAAHSPRTETSRTSCQF
jgi:hypothetical protein